MACTAAVTSYSSQPLLTADLFASAALVRAGRLEYVRPVSDQLVPVQQERDYARAVRGAGARRLLRQAFVDRQLHCNFTPAEELASVLALEHRLDAGRWGSVARPERLQASAAALDLGGAAFIRYRPAALTGNNGRFLPWDRH